MSLLGAMPLDNSIRQALPVNPEWPRETAELITLLSFLPIVASSVMLQLFSQLFAIVQRVDRSLFNHILQRDSIAICGLWLPLCFKEGRPEDTLWEHEELQP